MNKLTVFDASSTFAFFRKNFSTTNALTFAVIPRSAVEGLVSAIIGIDREAFPDLLKDSKIAIELLSTVRKLNVKYMHINHDFWHTTLKHYLYNEQFVLQETRAPMSVPASAEFLVNPSYRIYIDTTNAEINTKLADSLKTKQSYYTPCLDGSSMIASIKYVGEYDYWPVNGNGGSGGDYLKVSSVVPFSNNIMPNVRFERGSQFATEEDLAIHIDNERRSLEPTAYCIR